MGLTICSLQKEIDGAPKTVGDQQVDELVSSIDDLLSQIAKVKKQAQLTEKEHMRRCGELKENAKKQKGVINWKKTELKKLDKQIRNAKGEETRVKLSQDLSIKQIVSKY